MSRLIPITRGLHGLSRPLPGPHGTHEALGLHERLDRMETDIRQIQNDMAQMRKDIGDVRSVLRQLEPMLIRMNEKLDAKPGYGAMITIMLSLFAMVIAAIVVGLSLQDI